MNRTWITLVVIGVVAVVILVGWDFVLTITGNKSAFAYNIVPISPTLFGKVEDHLTTDSNFFTYQQAAAATTTDNSITSTFSP